MRITVTATPTPVACFGQCNGTVTATENGGTAPVGYHWSNAQTTAVISGLCPGVYTVTATDATGATATASATVTGPVAALSTTGIIVQPICFGQCNGSITTNTTGGTSAYSYLWSNAQTTANLTGLCAGNYTVTTTDAHGCTTTANFLLTAPTTVAVTILPPVVLTCTSPTETLTATTTTSPVTYNWGGGNTNATYVINAAGSYTVTASNASGCAATATVNVTANETPPNAAINPPIVLTCTTSSEVLTATSTTAGVTYNWGGWNSRLNTNTITAAGTYTVTVTNPANGCTATASQTVTANNTPPNVTIAPPVTLTCTVTSETLTASSTTAGVTYNWGGGITTNTYTVTNAGNLYSYSN